MKKSTLLIAVLAAALSVGSASAAPFQGGKQGVPVTQSNRDMRQGMKLARQAHKLLEEALPVYKGNRVDAMEDVRAGVKELMEALQGTTAPAVNAKGKPKGQKKNKANDNDSKSKYTPEQIAQSDKKLGEAVTLIDKAIAKLDNADPMYHGERMDAIAKLKDAQKNIGEALTIK